MTLNPYQSPEPITDEFPDSGIAPTPGGWKLVLIAGILCVGLWLFPLVNFLALVFLGWASSRAWPSVTRRTALWMPLVAGVLWAVLIATGIPPIRSSTGQVHQWCGLMIVTLLYCCVGFALGVLWRQKMARRPLLAVGQSFALLFCLAVTFSASLTGYLDRDPVPDPEIAEETHNRFVVLHMFVLPALIAMMLAIWHFAFLPPHEPQTIAQPRSGASQ